MAERCAEWWFKVGYAGETTKEYDDERPDAWKALFKGAASTSENNWTAYFEAATG